MLAVTDPEWVDVVPIIVKHLNLDSLGRLRRTCQAFRNLACILAAPKAAHSRSMILEKQLLETHQSLKFLMALPNLREIHLCSPRSLFGLHQLSQLTEIRIKDAGKGLDFRPLQEVSQLQRVEVRLAECLAEREGLCCIDCLTQVTSLLLSGENCLENDHIWELTSLAALEVEGNSFSNQLDWFMLSNLTSLKATEMVLYANLEALRQLRRLHILCKNDADYAEHELGALRNTTSLTSLTLEYSQTVKEDEEVSFRALQNLPGLQELSLKHCWPAGPLRLPALTALTLMTFNMDSMPRLRLCDSLRSIHIFLKRTRCLVSADDLPLFSPAEPLTIRHIVRLTGRLMLNIDLLQDGRVPDGLIIEPSDEQWPVAAQPV